MQAAVFLAKLRPTSRVLALTANGGLAVSDPYLSFPAPLADRSPSLDATAAIREVSEDLDIGGLLLLGGAVLPDADELTALALTLHTHRLTLARALARADAEQPFWDEIDLGRWGDPDIDAAVGLHDWLYEQTGGWPNTFG